MSKREDELLAKDILQAFRKIQQFVSGLNYDTFLANAMCVDAVVRNFEIIGEAANHLSPEFKSDNPQVEWRKLTDFRNILIHNYFGINHEILWDIIINQVSNHIDFLETLELK
jgi:uncharacterized protein with HEPN domain